MDAQAKPQFSHLSKHLPLYLWLAVSGISIWCFEFGFYDYPLDTGKELRLMIFLALAHVAFVFGYLRGGERVCDARWVGRNLQAIHYGLVLISLVHCLVVILGNRALGLSFAGGLTSTAEARQTWLAQYNASAYAYVDVLLSIFSIPAVAITFVCWNVLSPTARGLGSASAIFFVMMGLMGGARHNVYIWGSMLFIAAAVSVLARRIRVPKWLALATCFAALILFWLYSSIVVADRAGVELDGSDFVDREVARQQLGTRFTPDHLLLRILPNRLIPAFVSGTEYFGQGYYGLAEALSSDFNGIGFGFGQSAFSVRLWTRLFDEDIYRISYFYRLILEGYTTESNWISMYPWIASDVTFPGTIIVLFLFGILTSSAWRTCLARPDPYAAVLLVWMFQTMLQSHIVFSPGNYGALVGLYGSILLYLVSRARRGSIPYSGG